MSAKNRKKQSNLGDFYPTPMKLVRAGFDRLVEYYPRVARARMFLEPGAGRGNFCAVAGSYLPQCETHGVELHRIQGERFGYKLHQEDFLKWKTYLRFGLISTNPPFIPFPQFIHKSRELLTPSGLMFYLLRIGALGAKKRIEFWKGIDLRCIWLCRPRPSFQVGGDTDATEYAFFVMGGGEPRRKKPEFDWLDWKGDEDAE